MKIYSKILLIALPLIVLPALLVGIVSRQLSQNALQSVVQDVLGTRLTQAVDICTEDEAVLRKYGLENVPSNVARAQDNAATSMLEIRFGETGYVFAIDSHGIVRAHPDANLVGVDVSTEEWFQEIVSMGKGGTRYTWQGESRQAVFEYFEPWDWYIISSGAESELSGEVNQLGTYIVWLLAISLSIATAALLFLARWLIAPIHAMTVGIEKIRQGELETHIPVTSRDEIGVMASAFNSMTAQLRDLIGSLEQRVADRTADLAHRSIYLETAAQVARDAAAIRDVDQLLDQTVRLISERFGFYHAGIFLVDETGEYAVLQAASSAGGRRMLAREHKLKVGEVGIVGYAAGAGEPRIALDVGGDAVFFENPNLPDTRSEMALPLKSQEGVIGVLDVQSMEPEAFTEEDIAVLQTLADQITVAISNARLFRRVQESLETERRLSGELSVQAWRALLQAHPGLEVRRNRQGLYLRREGKAAESMEEGGLVLPIKVRGHTIGVLDARRPAGGAPWTEESQELLEMFTEQLGAALESARLFQDTQRRATRELVTREITDKMRQAIDMESLLRITAEQLNSALGAAQTYVLLDAGDVVGGDAEL